MKEAAGLQLSVQSVSGNWKKACLKSNTMGSLQRLVGDAYFKSYTMDLPSSGHTPSKLGDP